METHLARPAARTCFFSASPTSQLRHAAAFAAPAVVTSRHRRGAPLTVAGSSDGGGGGGSEEEPPQVLGDWRSFRAKLVADSGDSFVPHATCQCI